jgi:hypothetical protein
MLLVCVACLYCIAVLELDPESHLAIQTHIQILLSLDRYKDALAFTTAQQSSDGQGRKQWQLEQAYALYKLGKVPEAATIIDAIRAESMQLDKEEDDARAVDILDAQVVSLLFTLSYDWLSCSRNEAEIPPRGLRSSSSIVRRSASDCRSGEHNDSSRALSTLGY